MTTALFRQEAIDAQRAKIWGEATLALPISLTALTLFLTLSATAVGIFVATASYARKEHVQGYLAARLGVANILPSRAGLITGVHVKEGDRVQAGDPLLSVSLEETNEAGAGDRAAMIAGLREQKANLEQQLDLEQRSAKAEEARLIDAIAGLEAELAGMGRALEVQSTRTALATAQVSAISDLVKRGVVTQLELQKRQENALALRQAEMAFQLGIADKQAELRARQNELAQLPVTSERKRSQLRVALGDIDLKLRQTDADRAYLVTAPKAGRVSSLQAWAGKPVEAGVPQMAIVPEGDTLDADLFMPARAIGFVAPGQTVHLRYQSFPYQKFGFAEATIVAVSTTLLKPGQSSGPVTMNAPAYLVHAVLERQTIAAYDKLVPLQADMQLDADIIIDRRGLLAWLFDPLLAAWRRAA